IFPHISVINSSHKLLSLSLSLPSDLSLLFEALTLEDFTMKVTKAKSETTNKADTKLAVNRKVAERASKKTTKKAKPAKDPNMPKKPLSAFFVFMEEFRKLYKEKFPNNKSVALVGKAGGEKWKSMSDFDKAPYVAKAEKRKAEYLINVEAYKNKQANGPNPAEEEDGSDKSKSEVNDDEESGEEGDDE
ncbi:High mobility group b protein, partial [Thalictrum thalictroides]